ncbi:GNAT family N-acetyltransferase [Saccharothrix xinjiangensis]|uniref:GNAT family N-acetyltransferase n=1 Tax=Saccharothrix xinjiangensis TaxID=204798 RepID=A0ABV9YBU5_9PSEU
MTVTAHEVRRVRADDPAAAPMMAELLDEYVHRYGESGREEMSRHPVEAFAPPHGSLLLLLDRGDPVAGGAIMRHDDTTAEVKRVWTARAHRRRGWARRVMAELEREAAALGYRRVHLTTGPRQPEARELYLSCGYAPLFDVDDPPTNGPLPFEKALG